MINKRYETTVDLTQTSQGVSITSISQAFQQLTAVSFLTGRRGADGLPGAAGTNGTNGINGTNGTNGTNGQDGQDGQDGADGVGVPVGGTTGQALVKNSNTDFDTEWADIVAADTGSELSIYDVRDYGALIDGRRIRNITATSASATVTVPSGSFTNADIGKLVVCYTDTAAGTVTTIAGVSSGTSITLTGTAGITVSGTGGYIMYGTDDSAALLAAATAASASVTGEDGSLGDNQPKGLGQPRVYVPGSSDTFNSGIMCIGSAVTIPVSIRFDSQAMVANFISDRYAPFLLVSANCYIPKLVTESLFGSGIQLGTTGNGADIHAGELTMWHVGKDKESSGALREKTSLYLYGYSFLIDLFWCKGGYKGIYMNKGSDTLVNRAIIIGAKQPLHMSQSNQVSFSTLIFDSCGEDTPALNGLIIDNQCNNVNINLQAFCVSGVNRGFVNLVAFGSITAQPNRNINLKIQAQRTGTNVLSMKYARDVRVVFTATNSNGPSTGGIDIVTAVVWVSDNSNVVVVDGTISGAIVSHTGTPYGSYMIRKTTGDTIYHPQLTDDDFEITNATKGIVLTSPDLSRWRLTVDDSGIITTTEI